VPDRSHFYAVFSRRTIQFKLAADTYRTMTRIPVY